MFPTHVKLQFWKKNLFCFLSTCEMSLPQLHPKYKKSNTQKLEVRDWTTTVQSCFITPTIIVFLRSSRQTTQIIEKSCVSNRKKFPSKIPHWNNHRWTFPARGSLYKKGCFWKGWCTRIIFSFFPDLFNRKLFSSTDGFTGQSPAMWHSVGHLYTGGPRMCMGDRHVQASLLRRGQLVGWRGRGFPEDLADGRGVASMLWQPNSSWSKKTLRRHAWPHSEEVAGVSEIGCVGRSGENSAGKGAGLRLEHRLAYGFQGGFKFRSKTAVDLGYGSLLPATVVWLEVFLC